MNIVFISDFDMNGSGYFNIASNLCNGLANAGHSVLAVGLGYKNQQNSYPFRLLPADTIGEAIYTFAQASSLVKTDAVIVALDIPLQLSLMREFQKFGSRVPHIAITPLESDPLCLPWAMGLMQASKILFISEFAKQEALKAGIPANKVDHIRIGLDTDLWRERTKEEYRHLREVLLGVDDDTKVIFTNADNQERKNFGQAFEVMGKFKQKYGSNFRYVALTRPNMTIGWNLNECARTNGLPAEYVEFNRGLTHEKLWSLYACADVFFLPSKGEGLGYPVLEAMAVGVPVVGTKTGAITEHIMSGGGWLVNPEYVSRDPYGNANRYFLNTDEACDALLEAATGIDLDAAVRKAREYVETRNWDVSVAQLNKALAEINNG